MEAIVAPGASGSAPGSSAPASVAAAARIESSLSTGSTADLAATGPDADPGLGPIPPSGDAAGPEPGPAQRPSAGGTGPAPTASTSNAAQQLASDAPPLAPSPVAPANLASPNASAVAPGSSLAPNPAAATEEAIRLGVRHGFSRARLTLRPAELGAVEVVLRASADGVAARLVADSPAAARLLEGSTSELRSRLEAQGLQLLGLSVAVAGDAPSGTGQDRSGASGPRTGSSPSEAAGTDPHTQPVRTIELGGGVLVDVLA